jgi:hypothetical protein
MEREIIPELFLSLRFPLVHTGQQLAFLHAIAIPVAVCQLSASLWMSLVGRSHQPFQLHTFILGNAALIQKKSACSIVCTSFFIDTSIINAQRPYCNSENARIAGALPSSKKRQPLS